MAKNKLKPCLCGAIDEIELLSLHHTPIAEDLYYVECGICKSRTNLCDEEKDAVEAWNKRRIRSYR